MNVFGIEGEEKAAKEDWQSKKKNRQHDLNAH